MVAAFILVDLARIRRFLRSLVPAQYGADYDRILAGVDRGLSGVIRGQLADLPDQRGADLRRGPAVPRQVPAAASRAGRLRDEPGADLRLDAVLDSHRRHRPDLLGIVRCAPAASRSSAWIIGIHLVEANYLNPKIMGGSAKIHPVLVVFALIAGEHSYGLVGRAVRRPGRVNHPDHVRLLPTPSAGTAAPRDGGLAKRQRRAAARDRRGARRARCPIRSRAGPARGRGWDR